jgi:hypothetical protein
MDQDPLVALELLDNPLRFCSHFLMMHPEGTLSLDDPAVLWTVLPSRPSARLLAYIEYNIYVGSCLGLLLFQAAYE